MVCALSPELRRRRPTAADRGILVDQCRIYCRVQRFLPPFTVPARQYPERVGIDLYVDEMSVRIHDIHSAIDVRAQIVDTFVSPTRDVVAPHVI